MVSTVGLSIQQLQTTGSRPKFCTSPRLPGQHRIVRLRYKEDSKDVDNLLAQYGAVNSPNGSNALPQENKQPPKHKGKPALAPTTPPPIAAVTPSALLYCSLGIGTLLAVNMGVYLMAVYGGKASAVAGMVLGASGGPWWKYVSSAFVHASWQHLVRNLAVTWLSGTLLRRELSSAGIMFTYCLCAIGANMSAMMLMPTKAKVAGSLLGVGATGGAVGLALVALALGARFSLGYVIAATFFWQLVLGPIMATPVPGGMGVAAQPGVYDLLSHLFSGGTLASKLQGTRDLITGAAADAGLTWLWGAAAAALLVVLLARLPLGEE